MMRSASLVALVVLAACLPGTHAGAQGAAPAGLGDTVPPGFGSLRRDDITLRFATAQLQLQILPLDERVIRLLAPDTYRSLEQLIQSKQKDITDAGVHAGVANPTLVLVTFYGQAPGARFSPEDVQIQSRGRLFRSQATVPLSPTWGTLQLDLRQQAVAIYLFEDGLTWSEDAAANYQGAQASWSHSFQLLQQERARVRARAQSQPGP
ncbi:MAG TPA: hypothetical protein VNG04_12785 [Candidatus Acidoferrum sp.]|nr:hypothetical protein [Candidatus Acidoferrum sp.]HXJ31597.1 hypothetical protein [Gemmatimonadales bacterium]